MPSKKKPQKVEKKRNDPLLPDWLPPILAERAPEMLKRAQTSQIYASSDGTLEYSPRTSPRYHERLMRLLTDERMKSVWPELEKELYRVFKERIMPGELDNWVTLQLPAILKAATYADHELFWWKSLPSAAKWRKHIRDIHRRVVELRRLLYQNPTCKHDSPEDPTDAFSYRSFTVDDVLDRILQSRVQDDDNDLSALLRSLAEEARGRRWSSVEDDLSAGAVAMLGTSILLGDLPKQLALLETLTKDDSLPQFWRISKSDAFDLRVYVHVLSRRLSSFGLSPRPDISGQTKNDRFSFYPVLAAITEVARSLPENTLSADAVRKMRPKRNERD